MELDDGWKFLLRHWARKYGQVGVGIHLSSQLTGCVDEWVPLEWCACWGEDDRLLPLFDRGMWP